MPPAQVAKPLAKLAVPPVATPCRASANGGGDGESVNTLGIIPDILDTSIPKPTPGVLRISQEAIQARLRRVFTPNVAGQYKISTEIVQQWRNKKKGRKSLEQMFQSVGFCPDARIKGCMIVFVPSHGPPNFHGVIHQFIKVGFVFF